MSKLALNVSQAARDAQNSKGDLIKGKEEVVKQMQEIRDLTANPAFKQIKSEFQRILNDERDPFKKSAASDVKSNINIIEELPGKMDAGIAEGKKQGKEELKEWISDAKARLASEEDTFVQELQARVKKAYDEEFLQPNKMNAKLDEVRFLEASALNAAGAYMGKWQNTVATSRTDAALNKLGQWTGIRDIKKTREDASAAIGTFAKKDLVPSVTEYSKEEFVAEVLAAALNASKTGGMGAAVKVIEDVDVSGYGIGSTNTGKASVSPGGDKSKTMTEKATKLDVEVEAMVGSLIGARFTAKMDELQKRLDEVKNSSDKRGIRVVNQLNTMLFLEAHHIQSKLDEDSKREIAEMLERANAMMKQKAEEIKITPTSVNVRSIIEHEHYGKTGKLVESEIEEWQKGLNKEFKLVATLLGEYNVDAEEFLTRLQSSHRLLKGVRRGTPTDETHFPQDVVKLAVD